jgi:antitoxin ParD1/3/4
MIPLYWTVDQRNEGAGDAVTKPPLTTAGTLQYWQYMPLWAQEAPTMATMNVSLPDLMKEWVENQIKTGHYSNASDYVRDLIRRDQEYHDRRETLIKALITGENSGVSDRSLEDIWQGVKARHGLDL